MLLSYNKPVKTNSGLVEKDINVVDESEEGYMQEQIRDFNVNKINDEEIRSYWVSESNNDSIYIEMDLLKPMNIKALQINFQDFNSTIFGRPDDIKQQFVIKSSLDGNTWNTILDYSKNQKDMPHAYLELEKAVDARYLRYEHVYCKNEYLAVSELRVFGKGKEKKPKTPSNFKVERQNDRRNANLTWNGVKGATGYVIYWGIEKDKLNLNAMMYDKPNYELRALNTDQSYFMQVESFNENGISDRSEIIFVE